MQTGTIKFYNAGKAFGFVTPDEGGDDIYFPGTVLMAASIEGLSSGQRVTFEQAPDPRGPKIVALQLIAAPIEETPERPATRVTVLCEPNSVRLPEISTALQMIGYMAALQDIVATPLGADELRRLSHLMVGSTQSLVRRGDRLFFELQLDDRFIGDQEFWTTVSEHPALINGPILVHEGRARICKTAKDVAALLGSCHDREPPRALSPRVAAFIRGETLPPVMSTAASADRNFSPVDDIDPSIT